MIDYIITNERAREKIERMEVESRVDSDHQPITVWIKDKNTSKEGSGKRKGSRVKRGIWSEEGKKFFRDGFSKRIEDRKEIEEWKELKDKIIGTLDKMEGIRENNRKMEWWDEECRTEKAKIKTEFRKWRRERGEGDKYRKMKLRYKRLCEKKKREEIVRWIKEGQI